MNPSTPRYLTLFPAVVLMFILLTVKSKAQPLTDTCIHYITDTTADFNRLISKFKGKVIYVDVWATWCGPCVHDLRNKQTMKKFEDFSLKHGIVLLYICCDRNDGNWKQFVASYRLAGYHIFIDRHLDRDFHTTFSSVQNRQGKLKRSFYLPRHIIIDQNGMITDSTADRQGNIAVYQKLSALTAGEH